MTGDRAAELREAWLDLEQAMGSLSFLEGTTTTSPPPSETVCHAVESAALLVRQARARIANQVLRDDCCAPTFGDQASETLIAPEQVELHRLFERIDDVVGFARGRGYIDVRPEVARLRELLGVTTS